MRAAIVGSGYIARVHARLIGEIGGKVVAVCGRTLASAQAFGAGNAYDDMSAMLRAEKPDVVHVCSPNLFHAEQSIMAFEAGAHVLCEKPMATSADDCRRMIDAAAKAGRVGAIAYCYRGYPLIRHLRRNVDKGEYGELWRLSGAYLSQDVSDPEQYQWHFSPGLCGPSYALFDYGVHWLDLLQYVTGSPVAEIFASLSTRRPDRTWRGGPGQGPKPEGRDNGTGGVHVNFGLEDQADIWLSLESGASGCASVMPLSSGNSNHIALSVDGSTGGFEWQQESPNTFVERRPGSKRIVERNADNLHETDRWTASVPAGHPEGYLDAFRNVIRECWSGMRSDNADFPTFGAGLRSIEIVEAAIVSHRERRPVAVAHSSSQFGADYPRPAG